MIMMTRKEFFYSFLGVPRGAAEHEDLDAPGQNTAETPTIPYYNGNFNFKDMSQNSKKI